LVQDEAPCCLGFDEPIDVLPELLNGCKGCAVQGFSFQGREPGFHLIEPGGLRRDEVKAHLGMTLEPGVVLGLLGVEVVEDHVDCGDDIVHEIHAPVAIFVGDRDLARGHFEVSKQR
jgi:hypothetical protein